MHVGMTSIFQNPQGNGGDPALDAGVYETEYRLSDRAEALGFDSLWGVEHHLNGYAMCPDPLKFLMYFAGRTSHIRLGTMVVVAPWHEALRVAEDLSVLDHVSGGRAILGVGRGVAKTEFDAFRVDMNNSRELLTENIQAIQMGLETGRIEFSGKVVNQPPALVRPAPPRSFRDRIYGSAASPETYPLFAKLGIGLLFIPGGKPWDMVAADLDAYRTIFLQTHGREAPAPIFAGWTFVDEDGDRAKEVGRKYIRDYIHSALTHYDMNGAHMKTTRGYEAYVQNAELAQQYGITQDHIKETFVDNHIYGTPDECFEKIRDIREKLGAAGFLGIFSYAGMPEAEASRNQQLFAEKVMPRLKALEAGLDIGVETRMSIAAE